jgi:hypothetical protein
MCATCPAHPILHYLIILITFGEEYELLSSLLSSFLRVFSNISSQCSSLNLRDLVSRPHTATGKITVLYSFFFLWRYSPNLGLGLPP